MTESNRVLITQYFSCLSRHDVESAAALLAPGCQIYGLASDPLTGERWMTILEAVFEAFPDARFNIHDVVAEGQRIAVRHTFTGTHLAVLCGAPPTGRKVRVEGAIVAHFHRGRMQQAWLNADYLGLLQQLGIVAAWAA